MQTGHIIYKQGKITHQNLYKDIFNDADGEARLARQLLKFLEEKDNEKIPPKDLPDNFTSKFRFRIDLMERKESMNLNNAAKANLFPLRNLLPKWFNLAILFSIKCAVFLRKVLPPGRCIFLSAMDARVGLFEHTVDSLYLACGIKLKEREVPWHILRHDL